ncbi:MAG: hypothetical protein ACI3YC_07100 [Alloprevotella sp.]
MKKKRITYGINGFMDYQAIIKVGKANISIMFSDGTMTAFGSNPAKFTTDNFIIQQSIERSNEFKKGFIKVLQSVELDEDLKFESNAGEVVKSKEEVSKKESPKKKKTLAEEVKENPQIAGTTKSPVCVEFEFNDEAKDYLEKEFCVNRGTLINRQSIVECGKKYGVDITFI